jgi:hypothetical protein
MSTNELETVLENWIGQAISSIGNLPEGTAPAAWVTERFSEWLRERVAEALGAAELATSEINDNLLRRGGWESFGEELHELIHLRDALADMRGVLGIDEK